MPPPLDRYKAAIETRVDSHYPDDVVSLGIIVELFGMAAPSSRTCSTATAG